MPAVTITRIRSFVAGNRKRIVAFVNIAADADFLDVGNIMHRIEGISAVSETNQAIGATTSQGATARVTFQIGGGAENNVHVELTGL